jgi:translation initiation factor IF-2
MKLGFEINDKIFVTPVCDDFLVTLKLHHINISIFKYDISNIIDFNLMERYKLTDNKYKDVISEYNIYTKIEYKTKLNRNQKDIKIILQNIIAKLEYKYQGLNFLFFT